MTLYFRFLRLPCPQCEGQAFRVIEGVVYVCSLCHGLGTEDRMVEVDEWASTGPPIEVESET